MSNQRHFTIADCRLKIQVDKVRKAEAGGRKEKKEVGSTAAISRLPFAVSRLTTADCRLTIQVDMVRKAEAGGRKESRKLTS